ncbi:hypothetical protein [Amycolatopsis marina]|uniref:hypothetical protein n=1 Tax=Amycolatopsis marina TaxID=490629 RepID=UPI001160A12E|nr:hypothetical protein [Amycolatopsis marina]
MVTEGDPTGRYHTGRGWPRGGGPKGWEHVLWDNDKVSVISFEDRYARVAGVNSSGTVIASGSMAPTVLQNGATIKLPYDEETIDQVNLTDINERGDISASLWVKPESGTRATLVPAYYPAGKYDSPPVTLPLPDKTRSGDTEGIDDDGTMVGSIETDEGTRAYVWHPDGSHGFLPAPEGTVALTSASGIRDGWVVGSADIDGEWKTPRWRLDNDTVEVVPGDAYWAVNAQGSSVGTYDRWHAAVVISGKLFELPGLNQQEPKNEAMTINDDGTVIGGSANLPGSKSSHAVRWTCG